MKKIHLIFTLGLTLNSCGFNLEQECCNFDNFKGTSLQELAKAVRADNANKVRQILKEKSQKLTLKILNTIKQNQHYLYKMKKRNAFLELLKAGANSNKSKLFI